MYFFSIALRAVIPAKAGIHEFVSLATKDLLKKSHHFVTTTDTRSTTFY